MRHQSRISHAACLAAGCLLTLDLVTASARQVEPEIKEHLYFSPSIGVLDYEGDDVVKDGAIGLFRLGYDFRHWLSIEAGLMIAPKLTEQTVGYTIEREDGTIERGRTPYADEPFGDTYGAGLSVDALYHFTRWKRVDPYLTVGAGFLWYGDKVNGETLDPSIRGGGGVMYHFNNEWALRADYHSFLAGNDTEASSIASAGIVWTWGAHIDPNMVATGGPKDSDGDGLTDAEEGEIGTDPYDPDTDNDRLRDGEEVKQYKTDPLNPDSDWDMLKDGDEVYDHKTNPNLRDTDNGGVADGHEVIEDRTNPLDPSDDLLLFELYILFDTDKAELKAQYFKDLEVIGKVLRRNPGATAKVEGHADKRKSSGWFHNKRLSGKRAQAIVDHLATRHNIDRSRMESVGHGFDRPKGPNDPITGNPVNRRVDVYIRGVTDRQDVGAPKSGAFLPPLPENK